MKATLFLVFNLFLVCVASFAAGIIGIVTDITFVPALGLSFLCLWALIGINAAVGALELAVKVARDARD